MTMTQTSYEIFRKHYELYDFEILDGCYFYTEIGLFDYYINKYKKIKMESKGAVREEAKLFLNNLYGKLASSNNSSYKVPRLDKEKDIVVFDLVPEFEKMPGYIAIGSAITSYAREFTINVAQLNYDRFIYADTDSCHMMGYVSRVPSDTTSSGVRETPVGAPMDDVAFCHWKLESQWDEAIFVRQKTYIEHVTHDGYDKLENPYYNVKCAGMPDNCKSDFLKEYNITDFKRGLSLGGKLRPKRMKGGILLVETTYEMK